MEMSSLLHDDPYTFPFTLAQELCHPLVLPTL
jgi:hypothetical protein